jgi:hypothetical protein
MEQPLTTLIGKANDWAELWLVNNITNTAWIQIQSLEKCVHNWR